MTKPITYHEIKQYIESGRGGGCTLITNETEFNEAKKIHHKVGSHVHLKIRCPCGNSFVTTFNRFKNPHVKKNTCYSCAHKRSIAKQVFTYTDVKSYIENNSNCILLSKEYIRSHEKLFLQCACGHKFYVSLDKFKSGQTHCNECSKKINAEKRRKTTEQFKKEVYDLVKDEYSVLGNYTISKNKILMQHNICGYKYKVVADSFLQGTRCPKCFGKERLSTNEFKARVFKLVQNEYTVLGEYVSANTKLKMRHNVCNHDYYVSPSGFLNKHNRCPKCFGKNNKTTAEVKREIYDLVGDEYIVLNEYQNDNHKLKIRHNIERCGHVFYMRPSAFTSTNQRCPYCTNSHGELIIKQYLEKHKISYIKEYRIKECKDKRPLPFDFAIFEDKDKTKLKCLIEYDGEQHYRPMRFSKNTEKMKNKFLNTQYHDQIKDLYCKQNNIKLIRIPYWEFNNIDSILSSQIIN